MKLWNKINQLGFTLIELAMVIVILGILAAIAIPKYVDLGTEATDATKLALEGAVKSAFSISIVEPPIGSHPTVESLSNNVQGAGSAINTGVTFEIEGTSYLVQTYTDTNCATATTASTDTVMCVGSIVVMP